MVKEEKLKAVEKLKADIEKTPVIALIDMHKMPSKQLQDIRKSLRDKAKLMMTKKVVLKFAIAAVKKEGLKELESLVPKQPAIVLTDMGAFKLYALVEKLRFKTFSKEGDVANEDIWVFAGPTSLMAGPAISELQQAGVPASIESGKIAVRKDVCLVKKGEVISALKANVLRKLKTEPMEVLLNIAAVYENGRVYQKDVLGLSTKYPQMLPQAFNNALNLSMFIVFPTKENIKYLLAKASQAANAMSGLVGIGKKKSEQKTETTKSETKDETKNEQKELKEGKQETTDKPIEHGGEG